jgi:hypothetical protein
MKKLLLFFLLVGLNLIAISASADPQNTSIRFDFTDLKFAPQAKLTEHPDWMLGFEVKHKRSSYFSAVTLNKLLELYYPMTNYDQFFWNEKISLVAVGLIHQETIDHWVFPYKTPNTCLVLLDVNHKYTLKFLGTLYAQGGREQPHIENFSCQLMMDS